MLCAALAVAVCVAALSAHARMDGFVARAGITPQTRRQRPSQADPWPRGTVNVNTADEPTLCSLYGVGPALASAILADRQQNGAYRFPEDLLSVKGIGVKTLNGFRAQLDFSANADSP